MRSAILIDRVEVSKILKEYLQQEWVKRDFPINPSKEEKLWIEWVRVEDGGFTGGVVCYYGEPGI